MIQSHERDELQWQRKQVRVQVAVQKRERRKFVHFEARVRTLAYRTRRRPVPPHAVAFDEANEGCPSLTDEQAALLVGQLQHGNNGADPSNTFAGQNVLALVIQIDKSIVDSGGPLLGVSVSTYSSN